MTIAKDVKLQVEFNPHRVGAYRLIGYENRLLRDEDFKDDKKDAGDMGSGHTVTALYEIVPAGTKINVPGVDPLRYQTGAAPTEAARSGEWLTVKMRYKHPDRETSEEVSEVLRGEPAALENALEDFRFAAGVAAFALTLRESPYRGSASFDVAAGLAGKSLGLDPQGRRAEFLALIRKAQSLKPAGQ